MRTLATFTILALSLAACDREPAPAPETPTAATKLVAPGSAPTRTLAYAPARGTKQAATLTTSVAIGMVFDGAGRPDTLLPSLRSDIDAEVGDLTSGGFKLRFAIGGIELVSAPGVDESAAVGLRKEIERQNPVGLSGNAERASNGASRSLDFAPPRGAGATLRQMLGDLRYAIAELPVILPDDAVGADAEWTWMQRGGARDMQITEDAKAKLVRFDGDRAVIAIDSVLRAAPQTIALPGIPGDSQCELVSLDGTRRGEITFDPALPLPAAASIETVMNLALRVRLKGEVKAMSGHVVVRTTWTPR